MTPSRIVAFSLFLALWLGVFGLTHRYLYMRFVGALGISSGPALAALAALTVFLALSIVLARLAERFAPVLYPTLWWIASLWTAVFFYALLLTAAGDLAQWVWGMALPSVAWPGGLSGPWGVGVVLSLVGLLVGVGFVTARVKDPEITHHRIPIKDLPTSLSGIKIAQLSDIHIGVIVDPARMNRIVDLALEQNPDLIVITGDLVDEHPSRLGAFVPHLARLRARFGTFAVVGNHECYEGIDASVALMERAGITVLRDQAVTPIPGLRVIGIDDPTVAQFLPPAERPGKFDFEGIFNRIAKQNHAPGGLRDNIDAAVESSPTVEGDDGGATGATPEPATILLYHQPLFAQRFAALGVDLMLSGHTHGGQLWPFGLLARLRYPHVAGMKRVGNMAHYVHRGTGTWGPPVRTGAKPEIAIFELVPAS